MSLYDNLELINDAKAVADGKIVQRLIRRHVWKVGTKLIRKTLRIIGL